MRCADVDILAHPGLVSERDADEATTRGVYLEISARQGHCWSNGHVYQIAAAVVCAIVAIVYLIGGSPLGHHIKYGILFLGLAVLAALFAIANRPMRSMV